MQSSHVQLWTSSNYHWHLKQELSFAQQRIVSMQWDLESAARIRVLTEGMCLTRNPLDYIGASGISIIFLYFSTFL